MSEQYINIDTNLGPVGAVVTGVDLALPLSDGVLNEIKNAWYQHHVLFFPEQDLTPTQQAEFGARFGELDIYPFMKAVDSHKNVIHYQRKSCQDEFWRSLAYGFLLSAEAADGHLALCG